jgi:hypothetical protein
MSPGDAVPSDLRQAQGQMLHDVTHRGVCSSQTCAIQEQQVVPGYGGDTKQQERIEHAR